MAKQRISKRAKEHLKGMTRAQRVALLKKAEALFAVELITLAQLQKIGRGIQSTPYSYGESGKGY